MPAVLSVGDEIGRQSSYRRKIKAKLWPAAAIFNFIYIGFCPYYTASQREYPLAFEFRKSIYALGIGFALYSIYVLCHLHSSSYIIGLKLLLILAYLPLAIWLRIISWDETKGGVKLVGLMVRRWK